ncbi:MAG: hypothetical protein JXQ67_03105 [Campylobacterales bacterium]|nr:hypothetical protein [Campylobacterales bacterium]
MPDTETLKKRIFDAHTQGDIASLYVLEKEVQESSDEVVLESFYANILDLALERLTDTLESHRKMDLNEVQDFATTRALYEYAIEHYSTGDLHDAAALFEVLSGITDDTKFSDALKLHWGAASQKMSLDDFLESVADLNATQENGTFYISSFTKEAQSLLDNVQ